MGANPPPLPAREFSLQATPRFLHVAPSICLALSLTACGGDGPSTPPFGASLRVVLGGGFTDTVDARSPQALVVEARGKDGALASGIVVRFEAQVGDPTNPFSDPGVYVCTGPPCDSYVNRIVLDSTDALGRATIGVRLGHTVGRWLVRVSVPELGIADSARFTVTPGAPAAVHAVSADTVLDIGGSAVVRGVVVDRYDNHRTESTTLTAGAGSAVTVVSATSTVTARDMGTQWVFPRYNSVFDSTRVRVLPSGRLLVFSSLEQAVRLVDINGANERTVVGNVSSYFGVFPQFDLTRRRVTLHTATQGGDGMADNLVVIDTTGAPRRDVGPAAIGLSPIMATRQLADGSVLVVAARPLDFAHPDYSLWRVATDNTITFLAYIPDLGLSVAGADISHAGTKVAYSANGATWPPQLYVLDVASGTSTLIDANGYSPRWSVQDDRIVYLTSGMAMVANADGTGRRGLGSSTFTEGLAWSPNGTYIVGHSGEPNALRVLRVGDGAEVLVFFRSATGFHNYDQPDWR